MFNYNLSFTDDSGKLLNKLLITISLNRSEIFIANIQKHRQSGNRDLLSDEIRFCIPYLKAQLKIIKPKIAITLGRCAMNYFSLLESISKITGQTRSIIWQELPLTIFPVFCPPTSWRHRAMLAN